MSLTAGATLQSGKYLIEMTLPESDAGVSYQATHTSLKQPVVIQTLNPDLQQSPRFDLLRQQFLAIVRQGSTPAVIVRDCFEENGMPYVVIEPTPTPLKLSDWMPFLNAADSTTSVQGATVVPVATEAIAPPEAVESPQLPNLPASEAIAPAPARPAVAIKPRRNRWLPLALVLTAVGSGLAGAAFAWKLRSSAAAPSAPALFSREQTFPEKTDWLGEDPYAEGGSGGTNDYSSESASPAIERRSIAPRRDEVAPEPDYYEPRLRRSRPDRAVEPEPQPSASEKPSVEPPKIEVAPAPIPSATPRVEAPPPTLAPAPEAPVAPAPAELPSPKTQLAPIAPPTDPIPQ